MLKNMVLALAGIGFALLSSNPARADSIVRETQYGRVLGVMEPKQGGFAWLGVPFAKPPVGDLRWQPPQEPTPWNGVLKTQTYGNSCTQVGGMFGPVPKGGDYGDIWKTFFRPVGSEDCLYLNIWRPKSQETRLPVILFIHGGTNVVGTGADAVYVGSSLANSANAIVVTTNYRVGYLGWFYHPALDTGDALRDSGNFGLLDLIQSLRFIKNNIANFGGDPDNVTIMGQSAGATNVYALIGSPLAAGLFHKAIPLSGNISSSSPTSATNKANSVINALLIADGLAVDKASADAYRTAQGNAWIKNYLLSKTGDDLMRIQTDLTGGKWGTGVRVAEPGLTSLLWNAIALIADGTVLPTTSLANVIRSGNFNKGPMLIGNTSEEGKLFSGAFKVDDFTRFNWMIETYRNGGSNDLTLADLIDDTIVKPLTVETYNRYIYDNPNRFVPGPSITTSLFVSLGISALTTFYPQVPLYYYDFRWNKEPAPWNDVYGAWHTEDLSFIFGTFTLSLNSFGWTQANEPGRLALSNAMQKSIAAFIRTGNPNNSTLGATWDQWTPTSRRKMTFDATYEQAVILQE